jgi:UDP-N-acetyl-D-mannosaminuronic acid dehydrogenase
VGGHCISVDPWFLVEAAPDLTPLVRTARLVNDGQPRFAAELVKSALGELAGKRLAVLGLSFKPDVDDLRESPAIEVAHLLQAEGSLVTCFEPFKPNADLPGLAMASSLEGVLDHSDSLLLLVAHSQFRQLDPQVVARLTSARVAVDFVDGWDRQAWQKAGFNVFRLGAGK